MPTLIVGMWRYFLRLQHAHGKRGHGTQPFRNRNYFGSACKLLRICFRFASKLFDGNFNIHYTEGW